MTENHPTSLLKLPSSDTQVDNAADHTSNLNVQGSSIKLDDLGPMVVNSDGTLSRIANWSNMTEVEQARTLRVLSARNKVRLANEERKLAPASEGTVDNDAPLSILAT